MYHLVQIHYGGCGGKARILCLSQPPQEEKRSGREGRVMIKVPNTDKDARRSQKVVVVVVIFATSQFQSFTLEIQTTTLIEESSLPLPVEVFSLSLEAFTPGPHLE